MADDLFVSEITVFFRCRVLIMLPSLLCSSDMIEDLSYDLELARVFEENDL